MTKDQLSTYWADDGLWANAVRGQGWDRLSEADLDRQRREVTKTACLMVKDSPVVDSIAKLNEDQITALFKLLIHLARPLDVAAARAVANPEETRSEDKRRRLIHEINAMGFHRNYVQAIAKWQCRKYSVSKWEDLPMNMLFALIATVNKNRRKKGMPAPPKPRRDPPLAKQNALVFPSGNPVRDYVLKPAKKFAPVVRPF